MKEKGFQYNFTRTNQNNGTTILSITLLSVGGAFLAETSAVFEQDTGLVTDRYWHKKSRTWRDKSHNVIYSRDEFTAEQWAERLTNLYNKQEYLP